MPTPPLPNGHLVLLYTSLWLVQILCTYCQGLDPPLGATDDYLKLAIADKIVENILYINKNGRDLPEIRDGTWNPPQRPRP